MSVAGGALMAATFFLPAVQSCNSDIVPASTFPEAVADSIQQPAVVDALRGLATWIPILFVAYLAGLVLGLAAAARLAGWAGLQRWSDRSLIAILVATAITLLALFGDLEVRNGMPSPSLSEWPLWLALLLGPAATLAYLALARRPASRLQSCSRFLAAFWMTCWFAFWLDQARYGLWLSIAAALLLLLSAVGDARTVTRQSWPRTVGQLLIGRLRPPHDARGRCPRCDYLLFGLSELRCPECGRAFTLDEVGLTPDPGS